MTKKRPRKSPEPCPKCGSLDIVPIMYGLPGPEAGFAVGQGKIILGGCLVTGSDPQKQCKVCGAQFDFQPLREAPEAPERDRRRGSK
jgi:hypothetical protein